MPQDYTVELVVGDPRPWEWNGHKNLGYELKLKELAGETVEHSRKPDSPAPAAGEVIYGHLEDGKFGRKLKKDSRQNGSHASSSNGGSQDGPDEAYWEAKNRAIQRQAAHKSMCAIYELGRTEGIFGQAADAKEFYNRLKEIADWLDRDTDRARGGDEAIAF